MIKSLSVMIIATVITVFVTGCNSINISVTANDPVEKSVSAKTAFAKGVYLYYEEKKPDAKPENYYSFTSGTDGFTDNGISGLPFIYEQRDNGVWFSFGGADPGSEDFLTVVSVENGTVKGHFMDGKEVVFSPVPDVDPETFDALNFQNAAAGENLVYNDANGWSVKYDPKLFTVNGGGPRVTFVYTGESAGTNMITASYNVDKDAETAVADLAAEWGDNAGIDEGVFPGTEDVTGYWVTLPPENDGSGLYSTAVARDYMDGYLMFELTGHNSGEEETDMAVSDALAAIIDSLEFTGR